MGLQLLKDRALGVLSDLRASQNSKNPSISVLGDLALDRFIFGNVERISPEAPVPVLLAEYSEERAGCAANVVQNLDTLSVDLAFSTQLFGIVGPDSGSARLIEVLKRNCQKLKMSLKNSPDWVTPVKTRFIAGSHHQLLRVDEEIQALNLSKPLDFPMEWIEALSHSKVALCQDYSKGLLREKFLSQVLRCCREKGIPVLIDPNRNTPPEWYRGASLLTPNVDEAERLWGRGLERGHREDLVLEAAHDICRNLSLDSILITRGKHGMTGYTSKGQSFSFPSFARDVFDVTGAGDTVIAVLGAFLALGVDLPLASYFANAAASVVVSKVGTATVRLSEIEEVLQSL